MVKLNIKEKYRKLKELWKDPKSHALILLGFYGIFILFLAIIFRLDNNSYENNNEIKNDYTVNNFEYNATITISGIINDNININGIKYEDINEFEESKTKQKYYIKDDSVYNRLNNEIVTDGRFYINLNSIDYSNLKYIIDNNVETNKIEYNDQSIKKEYIINNIFFSDVTLDILNITTYEKNNYITEINISFIYNQNNYNIAINYENINNISSYTSK